MSLWSSVPFKQTSVPWFYILYWIRSLLTQVKEILKRKIYLGKRAFSGTYSYTEFDNIMNDTLLGSDVDIFLYNTKIDTKSQASTRVAIIAGTNLSLHTKAPYIQSQIVSGTTQSLSLDIINPSLVGGDINIQSLDSPSLISGHTASVIVNNIIFPTLDESGLSASNEKVLFMQDGELIWDLIQLPQLNYIGNTGSQLDIYGTPTNLFSNWTQWLFTRIC